MEAKMDWKVSINGWVTVLTAHGDGLLEDLRDLRVHLDHQVLLDRHLLVTSLDLILHPVRELLFHYRRADVGQPGLGDFWELKIRFREVSVDLRVLLVE